MLHCVFVCAFVVEKSISRVIESGNQHARILDNVYFCQSFCVLVVVKVLVLFLLIVKLKASFQDTDDTQVELVVLLQ